MIAWESAGSAGFKGSRKSTPFAAQVTADACARKGMEHGLQKVEVFVKGPGSGRETAIRSLQAAGLEILGVKDVIAAGPQRRPPQEAEKGLGGSRHVPEVQAVPPGGHEALPEGRALPDREVRDRAPQLSAGRARPRPDQAERVPAAAAREAEGAPLLRPARDAVPHLLREGRAADRHHRREPAADARDAARQRRLPARLRRLARAGPPARPPRPLPRQRPPREHPELPGQAGRHRHLAAGLEPRSRSCATRPI